MIIDDSELHLFHTKSMIKKSHLAGQVETFNSPVTALEQLHSIENHHDKFPNVIFLDIHMPLMNGFDFLDEYLEFSDSTREHCEIVMVSSTDSGEDFERASSYPFIHKFISKPLTPEKLNNIKLFWGNNRMRA